MIWHLVPAHVLGNTRQGSYKDVSSRVAALQAAGPGYRQVVVDGDFPDAVLGQGGREAPTHVFVEYSYYPRILAAVRRRFPGAALAVRAINIEPMQHISNHGLASLRRAPWVLYGAARLFAADVQCRRLADVVYPISEWEADRYWRRLPGRARVEWLPYVTPAALVPDAAAGGTRGAIACLPTSLKNRKSLDLVTRFVRFAARARALGRGERFVLTGDLASWGLRVPPAVEIAGMIPDLKGLMSQVRAVAILSPLGYGFKTTLMDAIAAGAFVLLHPTLYRRCPAELRPACIPVGDERDGTIGRALDALSAPFPLPEVNRALARRALDTLAAFCGGS